MKTWPNWVDLIVITVFIRACYRGYARGVFSELLSLIGVVSITALTANYAGLVAQRLLQWFSFDPTVATCIVFWLIFLTAALGVRILIRVIGTLFPWERRHWLSQFAGLAFGAMRGLWWSAVILVALNSSNVEQLQGSVEGAILVGQFADASKTLIQQVSADFPYPGTRPSASLFPPARAVPQKAAR